MKLAQQKLWKQAVLTVSTLISLLPNSAISSEIETPDLSNPLVQELGQMLCSDRKFVPWIELDLESVGDSAQDSKKPARDTSEILSKMVQAHSHRTAVITESNDLKYLPSTQMNTDVLLIADSAGALDASKIAAVSSVAAQRKIRIHIIVPGKTELDPADDLLLNKLAQATGGNILKWPSCRTTQAAQVRNNGQVHL